MDGALDNDRARYSLWSVLQLVTNLKLHLLDSKVLVPPPLVFLGGSTMKLATISFLALIPALMTGCMPGTSGDEDLQGEPVAVSDRALSLPVETLSDSCAGDTCDDPPTASTCGEVTCEAGLVCCNASCGICAPPDGFCTQEQCGPMD